MDKDDIKLPYTMRFSRNERKAMEILAEPLGCSVPELIRFKVLNEDTGQQIAYLLEHINEQSENAKILAELGKSRIANNLNQIAKAINTGTLEITPDVVLQINEAYEAILWIRSQLIRKQGLKA